MLGGIMSFTVIICVHVAELPQTSVALYVRVTVNLLAHVWPEMTSLTNATVKAPLQLSVAETRLGFGSGSAEPQLMVIGPGQVILGGVTSFTVIIWAHVAEFPQRSVAL